MKSLNIDSFLPWEVGVVLILFGLLLIFFGIRQGKKPFDIKKLPLTRPTAKIIFGSAFLIIGFIQMFPLLK